MEIREYQNAAEFLQKAQGFLMEREAENNLMLGQAARLAQGDFMPGKLAAFYTVEDDGKVLVAAMHNQPYRIVITRGQPPAIAMIADYTARKKVELPGVIGPFEPVEMFVRAWSKLSRDRIKPMHRLRIYQLEHLEMPPPVSGHLEPAMANDTDFLHRWNVEFVKDVKQPLTGNERVMVERAIAEQRLFVWKDPQIVSMAAWAGPTPHGCRINMVYTSPELRGRGYASNAVAALTKRLLDSGRKFVFLYTDLDNPTSNKIYRQLGYEPVVEINEVDFEKPTPPLPSSPARR